MNDERAGLLRALAFHDAWGYAPTRIEWLASWDAGANMPALLPTRQTLSEELERLLGEERVVMKRGRHTFSGREELVDEHEAREALFPRKIRRACRVAKWLRRLAGIRFVALCNTSALAHAREEADLDFFIVTNTGCLWQTRGAAALPFKLLGARPGGRGGETDAVCLSFFVDESALDLSPLQLDQDDPYFRHWFLSLLPLYDDGVGERLWNANESIRRRHPFAECWLPHPTLTKPTPKLRWPTVTAFEPWAIRAQSALLPPVIRETANRSTDVVVNEHVLKLHTTDGRDEYRAAYYERCKRYAVEP